MNKITLYFVRHGKTDTNEKGLLIGQSGNPVLVEEGRENARLLGRRMAKEGIIPDAVYTSPYERTKETARLILEGLGISRPLMTSAGIRDASWGEAEGMTMEEMVKKFRITSMEQCFGRIDDPDYVSPMGCETLYAFYHRFSDAVDEIIAGEEPGRKILIVAHSSMGTYFGGKYFDGQGVLMKNTSLTTVTYDYDTKEWTLEGVNE